MSKMMDFLVKGGGKVAELEATIEHMGGCLEREVEEGAKTRAAFLRTIQQDNNCKPSGLWCREWVACGCYLEMKKLIDEQAARPIKCEGCDTGYADPPSRLCPGCQAYVEHQR